MGDIVRLPRPNPKRRWSPVEILAIKEKPDNNTQQRQERARIGATRKIASEAGKRGNKRARRKQELVNILSDDRQWTIARLMRSVEHLLGEPISRTTVTALLEELEAEGQVSNTNQFWKSTEV